jgi:hypothetical protein
MHFSVMTDSGSEVLPAHDAKHYGVGAGAKEGGACMIDGRRDVLKKVEGGFLCVPIGEDAMNDSSPMTVVDALGRAGLALHQPGSRFLVAGKHTTDHAVLVMRDHQCREARDQYIAELCDAWKSTATGDREIAHIHNSGDAVRDAYLDQKFDLENSWHRGTGKR